MPWAVIDPATLTDEDRRIMRELIEEERREREARFWDSVDRSGWDIKEDE